MSVTAELVIAITSLVTAVGAIAKLHMERRMRNEGIDAQVRASAEKAFEGLFRDERAQRERDRTKHRDEIQQMQLDHESEIARIETVHSERARRREAEFNQKQAEFVRAQSEQNEVIRELRIALDASQQLVVFQKARIEDLAQRLLNRGSIPPEANA